MANATRFVVTIALVGFTAASTALGGWRDFFLRRECPVRDSHCSATVASDSSTTETLDADLVWHDDYGVAHRAATEAERMLLINFVPTPDSRYQQELLAAIAENQQWQRQMREYVLLSVPTDAEIQVKGNPTALLRHAAFAEMHGRGGIAIIDLKHLNTSHYGRVVTAIPFMTSKYYYWRPSHLGAALDLPAGTITQRTMVWAVRTHPESPASTQGEASDVLLSAAGQQSQFQAQIGVQGHQNWDSRFHRIRSRLGFGAPVEVVAESWPNQTMIDSCIDCVQSWRHSPGHWGAVRSRQSRYGFDIRRGRNGIWYGTGIFVR